VNWANAQKGLTGRASLAHTYSKPIAVSLGKRLTTFFITFFLEIIPNALERYKTYGPIMRFWAGPLPIVSVAKAEYVEV